MDKILKIVKKEKDGHVFYNIYLFGVGIKTVNQKDYSKLYFMVKGYLNEK